jgi:MFS family permease
VVAYAVVAQAAFAGAAALKALFLLRTLRLPVELYGVPALAAAGLGAVGSVLAARLVARGGRPGRVAVGFWAAGALSALALPSAAGPVPVALAVATLGVAVPVLCGAAANVAVVAIVGEQVPQAVLGRVNACLVVAVALATVNGSLVAGHCADLVGIRPALWGCAAVGVAGLALLAPLVTGRAGTTAEQDGASR